MSTVVRFLLIAGASASVVVIVALLWPRLTSRQRPQVLQAVYDTALTTQPGKDAAKILGVENEGSVKPISVNNAVASIAGVVAATMQEKTKEIISQQVTTQIINQYQNLPQSQQEQLQELICKPKQ